MKLSKLESLRGFAAIYVVLHHALPREIDVFGVNLGLLFRFGQEAVILFFLLSGFVINYSFQKGSNRSFSNYFYKRAMRIYIPLILVMLLGWLIASSRVDGWANPQLIQLLLNLLMLQDIGFKPNVIVAPYMGNSPLWSLSYEWWFYMLYYPIQRYIVSTALQQRLVYSVAVLATLIYIISPTFIPRILMYLSIWWMGVALSNVYLSNQRISFRKIRFALFGLALVCIVNLLNIALAPEIESVGVHPLLEFRHHAFALLVVSGALVWQHFKWRYFDRLFRPFLIFAPMSYAIYISHIYFIGPH
ncbi:MAG: peptidoglycan/LPS O-acetylase OafA/YrhL, partial [Arenicella sp.]